jgi:Tfp pilus assembly protein PilF
MGAAKSVDELIAQAANLRREQRMEAALDLLAQAARQAPTDPRVAFGLAQTSFECWRPAADLFAAARCLLPEQPELVRNHALALAAEGEGKEADALIDAVVERQPLWLDGHRTLASMRATQGNSAGADASYRRAMAQQPDQAGLRLAWFQHHAIARNWPAAQAVLDGVPRAAAPSDNLAMARLFLRSESGDPSLGEADLAPFAARADPGFDLCRLRYLLRHGEALAAATIAHHIGGPQARSFWPYLSLCWRLLDDPRAHWLDGRPPFVELFDLQIPAAELAELAAVLRSLHRLSAPYPEQSVRGGTQTDRQLFFNPDPAIQKVRQRVVAAGRDYLAGLPAPVEGHPLLGPDRNSLLFAGSWSVRLAGAGYHASHTHVLGWISSALYVALPGDLGPLPAGCLALGTPPPELGLDLVPYSLIEPAAGKLALFPSTMWHATEPFGEGERLTIAFDFAIPQPA